MGRHPDQDKATSKTVFQALKIISVEGVYKIIIILKHYCVSVDISYTQRQVYVFLLCISVGHRVNTKWHAFNIF